MKTFMRGSALASLVAVGISGAAAYAYFENQTTISGSGSATVTTKNPANVSTDAKIRLSATATHLDVFTNGTADIPVFAKPVGKDSMRHRNVTITTPLPKPTIKKVHPLAGKTCPAGSFSIGAMTTTPLPNLLPVHQTTRVGTLQLMFNNLPQAEQSGCLGATVSFMWSTTNEIRHQ